MNTSKTSRFANGSPPPATREQISALAHAIWRDRGCPVGCDVEIWLEAQRQLNGAPAVNSAVDPIPADPDHATADEDVALNPATDQEIRNLGGRVEQRSPTSLSL